jgi:ABC-2 type transport system permease protein
VVPLVTFGVIILLEVAMLLLSLAILGPGGLDAVTLWQQLPVLRASGLLLYGLAALALWHAPVYAWLLLVSGWARRTTFLWAVLPPLALCVVERIAFGTWHLLGVLQRRLGGFSRAFSMRSDDAGTLLGLPQADPAKFFTTPGLWIGIAIAVALFAATVRMRRYREPI